MSDILIKNMKMPDKATTIVIFSEGKARVFRQDIDHDEWLTAIEVPPHGRLIDADELHKKAFQRAEKIGDYYNCMDFVISAFDIENAQTIIPSVSEEREG